MPFWNRTVVLRPEPEPLLPSGKKWVAYQQFDDDDRLMPLYMGRESIEILKSLVRLHFDPYPVVFLIEE